MNPSVDPENIVAAIDKDLSRIIFRRRYLKYGYEFRRHKIYQFGRGYEMKSGYSLDGDCLGDIKMTNFLTRKMGIRKFEKIDNDHCVCSIGFNPQNNTWYGWSHRAICGFTIGNKIFEEDFGDENTSFKERGTQIIKNIKQAKLSAKLFANYVS